MEKSMAAAGVDRPRILVVDDDPAVCKIYQNTLSKRGYEVNIARTYRDAAAFPADPPFDVIISDIYLGTDNGLDILAASESNNSDTPVILVTGMPTVETASAAVRLNAFEYLVKPVPLAVLADAVCRAVKFRTLKADQKKVELEKRKYQRDLEHLVAARTEKLIQSHKRYQEQNKFLNSVIESLAHPFMVIDTHDYRVRMANSAAVKNRSLEGMTCYALNHGADEPCDSSERDCPLKEVVRCRRAVHMEHVHLTDGGKEARLEVHAFPLFDDHGQIRQVIQYCIDITEKKRLEAIAEAANLMDNLGFIFAGIRHEIGNPLNSVKMALSVLDKNLERYPRQTIREFIERSLGELSRVEYLLKALKNFSLFETPDVDDVDLHYFLTNFKALIEADFVQNGIAVFLDLTDGETFVRTDPRAFHQVMLNVMTNAADAVAGVQRPMIDIAVARLDGFVQVKVRDNGCGMTPEELKNLFRPFYTSKPNGTGLGLMIVKKMLSKMASTVCVESYVDTGTTVTMTLPAARLKDGR